MCNSKVEKLSEQQQCVHDEFTRYLINVVHRQENTARHLTESIERRVQIFARGNKDKSFTCIYDYTNTSYLQSILEELKSNITWMDYNKRHARTLTSGIAHYINFLNYKQNDTSIDKTDSKISDIFMEGEVRYIQASKYERDPKARKKCIEKRGCFCNICGFDFEKVYGETGKGFIEVHHIIPINEQGGNKYLLDPTKDLIPLCSNCHAMIHKRNPVYSIEEMKELLKKHKNKDTTR